MLPLNLNLLLLLFLTLCHVAVSTSVVTHLPGYQGPLPFYLETGYVTVDEEKGAELFYYFVESEGEPEKDPLLIWLTGGPGCSSFSALATQIGPIQIIPNRYDGTLPKFADQPYAWTKVSSIVFVDSPIGTGFSFARDPETAYEVGDSSASLYLHEFITKWLVEHPKYFSCPLYIAGDSYSGKIVPIFAHLISKSISARKQPLLNLKGYIVGNPYTGDPIDFSARFHLLMEWGSYLMTSTSDEEKFSFLNLNLLHTKEILESCKGVKDYDHIENAKCATQVDTFQQVCNELEMGYILDPRCPIDSPKPIPEGMDEKRSLQEYMEILDPPPAPELNCAVRYELYLTYYWMNNNLTREALHIKEGTVGEWLRCNRKMPYMNDIPSSLEYHLNLTKAGYRALVFSGDHDLLIPFMGTYAWIKSLGFPITNKWRSWHVKNQVAGYTTTFSNNLTFATVKAAGHVAAGFKPKQCFAMAQRWLSYKLL